MKIFIRVLQLLKLNNPADKWNWLEASAVSYPRYCYLSHSQFKDFGGNYFEICISLHQIKRYTDINLYVCYLVYQC